MDTCQSHHNSIKILLPWLIFVILGRVLPHPPNVSPLLSATLLLSGLIPQSRVALLGLLAFILSDIILSFGSSYAAFGLWSLFTYSGFIAVLYLGARLLKQLSVIRVFYTISSASLLFWLWTNIGTWLTSGLYPHTVTGLTACFVAAIPFLSNAVLGDLLWGALLFAPWLLYQRKWQSVTSS